MRSRPLDPRNAFTLAEMLVALGIILLLVSMTAFAILRFRNTGPYNATVANMNKIKAALDTQWKAVVDKAKKDSIPDSIPGAKVDPNTRQSFLAARLKQAFPQDIVEANGTNNPLGPHPGYVKFLTGLQGTFTPDEQNAVFLMMILERGPSNPGITPDVLGTSAAIRLGTASSAFGVVDAWGRPLRFIRNPNGYLLRSDGPDGKPNTDDDIVSNQDL